VPAGWGGSFSKTLSPTHQAFPHLPETRKITKKPAFTVSHKILELKEVTFENRYKNYIFLSGFSVLIYIFEEN
jgi:hypothetical protein